jgi:hypothetical protein
VNEPNKMRQGNASLDVIYTRLDARSATIDPSLTSLPAKDRETYAAIVDDILAEYGEEVVSSDDILDMLRERTSLALTRQRHHLKLLIIERLKRQPSPQTVALTYTGGGSTVLGTTSIAATAFNVPELLESILIHVPMIDLIAGRRVNKAFHRLIETSPVLQRKLFLLPSNDPLRYWNWICNNGVAESLTTTSSPPPVSADPCTLTQIIASLNPLLYANDSHFACPADDSLKMLSSAKIERRVVNSQGWPEMYLTSPPCTKVRINLYYSEGDLKTDMSLRLHFKRDVYNPAGVTFACIWNALHVHRDVKVWDYSSVLAAQTDYSEREDWTVGEHVGFYRRRGITLSLDADESYLSCFSVAIPTANWEC